MVTQPRNTDQGLKDLALGKGSDARPIVWTLALVGGLALALFFMMIDPPASVKLAHQPTGLASTRRPASITAQGLESDQPAQQLELEVPCSLPSQIEVPATVFQVRLIGTSCDKFLSKKQKVEKATATLSQTIRNVANGYSATVFETTAANGSKSFSTDYITLGDNKNPLRIRRVSADGVSERDFVVTREPRLIRK